ncbi:aldo/keto reductase [Martelella alba]|uniref:Aldo/keto reductase n=1 Tax=Martelella alba TaxID=2590451 RepID=A0A506U7T7_9HYPH|nr:aldo/keto reductase [Martelella alba]TPW30482.1 aldo/keto reductase [Martelella alba]
MLKREIGRSGISASALALGTWAIGGSDWGGTDEDASIAAIHAGLDAGIDLIDTAPIYGFGLAEELVGKAISGRRDSVVLATKCGLVWGGEKGAFFFPSEYGKVHRYLGRDAIRMEVEASLKRLKTDYIDLYQTHFQEPTTPIAETMEALLELKQEGKIRAIGISNASAEQLADYLAVGQVDVMQEQYSMVSRDLEGEVIPLALSEGVGILAYSPLAMGLLSGRMRAERSFGSGDVRGESKRFAPDVITRVNTFLDSIAPIAADHDISMVQLVLAWTLARPGITHVLSGVRNRAQADENVAAANVSLSADEMAAITAKLDEAALNVPPTYG